MKNTFRELTLEEMILKREELRKEYFILQCGKVISHVQDSAKILILRRCIAQLNTLIYNHADIEVPMKNSGATKNK